MRTIIVGAGEVGWNLAATFMGDKQDVVVIDTNRSVCSRLRNRLDVMTVTGNGAAAAVLLDAGAKNAGLLIAVTNNDTVNLWACRLAKHYGVGKTICRLSADIYFDPETGVDPVADGVDFPVIPNNECVRKVLDVLDYQAVRGKINFRLPQAVMTTIRVMPDSPLAGLTIGNFPDPALISTVRFCAIERNHELLVPHGDTVVLAGDDLYIAGTREMVAAMCKFINPGDSAIRQVVIAGATDIGRQLAVELKKRRYNVTIIEDNGKQAEAVLDESGLDVAVLNGDPNDDDILDEAGVSECDAFVSTLKDNENNILSCILAKRHGAKKVVSLTDKSEYIQIIPNLDMIDCGFSTRIIASNSILRHLFSGDVWINASLHRVNTLSVEFTVANDAKVAREKIRDCQFSGNFILSLVFRNSEVLVPHGDLELLPGDIVQTIANYENVHSISGNFRPRGWFAK